MGRGITIFVLISFLIQGCVLIPATQTETERTQSVPWQETEISPAATASALSAVQLPATDQIILTIPNPEPFFGLEGEPRPDWLGWGAETFVVASDGSFWIDDTATYPNRLLHYSPRGEFLLEILLENLIVYAYDLAVTQDSVWVLDVSSQPPKIVELDRNGKFRSGMDFLREIREHDGALISNGRYSLFLGEDGELLLQSDDGYYEMVDASGKITARRLDALTYNGHTYRTGIFSEATGRTPVFVDDTQLEISPEFSIELPFLGFNQDGSFAIAGTVENAEHQIDRQVRYYGSSGELLGTARQRPQTFYKDWNHHLAFGGDGSVYQLLSNPDHSVQILRLGFSEQLPALVTDTITPTPFAVLQPSDSAATDQEQARNTVLAFFFDLSTGNYEAAAAHYGGEKSEYARELMPGESMGEYWEYICTMLLSCLPVADITKTEQVSENEFVFQVVFMQADGMRFEIGACCGGDPAAYPPVWQFAYPVKKIDGVWKVMRGPMFTP